MSSRPGSAAHLRGDEGLGPHREERLGGLGAVVVCGGYGRRMGGPKAWLPFGETTLLEHVVTRISQSASIVVVAAAEDQLLPPLPERVRIVRDRERDAGPLEGLTVGVEALRGAVSHAFVTAVDAPFVVPAFVRRMQHLASEGSAVPVLDGRRHPLAAVVATGAAPALRALRETGERRAGALVEAVAARLVSRAELLEDPALRAEDPALRSLTNINHPDEHRAALESLRRS